jgi:[protein-PII] uridylyltransferase
LLDARHVAGDRGLTAELSASARVGWVKGARGWLPRLRDSLDQRASTPGEVAFVLEPDLKLGRGGLRDAHVLRWLGALEPRLVEADRDAWQAAHERLLEARVALHRRTGRRGDVLLLQEQDGVATDLGYRDADDLMAAVAGAARTIEWLTDEAMDRVSLAGFRWRRRPKERRLGGGVVLRDGQIHLEGAVAADVAGCVQLLDVARMAAEHKVRIGRDTLQRLAAADLRFPDPWPLELRERFVEFLRSGWQMIPVVETLDHFELWCRVLPEWQPNRSRPQRNAYHRFTVDRHLCEATANAAALTGRVERPDLLVVGTLLHDIGKGFPPHDHTDIGIELVATIGPRMGFDAADTATLCDLVRYHLLLPDVATRRDLSDEATIRTVADALRTEPRLHLLHALTEADAEATGPAAWGEWKASLVRELVDRTARYLAGTSSDDLIANFPTAEHRALMRGRAQVVQGRDRTLTVVSPDRPGLFCRVAGVLALNGLDVLSANAHSDDTGMALEQFTVSSGFADAVDWAKVERDVDRALAGQLALRARLADRARMYGRRRRVRPEWAPFEKKVVIDNEASAGATVLEVRAPDAVGLLFRVTSAMADLDLDIRSARIQTLADHVVDAFYVRNSSGQKITDPEHLAEIERALHHAMNE